MNYRQVSTAGQGISLAFALTVGPMEAAAAGAPSTIDEADTAAAIETVIVTGSRRPQPLMDAPTGITVLTDARIEALGSNGLIDYMGYVPGLEFNGGGAPGVGTIIIRGIDSGYSQVSQTVGFYIDDVPFTESSTGVAGVSPDPDLTDVERIEVLKGPQSTLFGASALGGLIRVITKQPDLAHFTGELIVDGAAVDGGGAGGGFRGVANLPIVIDKLALRLTAFDRVDPGYVENVQTGQHNINSDHVVGGRATLLFAPNSKTDFALSAFVQDTHDRGTAQEDLDPNSLQSISGTDKYASYFDPHLTTNYEGASVAERYRGGSFDIENTTAYSHFFGNSRYDFTISYSPLFGIYGANFPDQALVANFTTPLNKFTEEVHVNARRIGAVELQGGLFYTHEQADYDVYLIGENGANGAKLPSPYGNFSTGLQSSTFEEYAGFADATIYLSNGLDGTLGVRQSYNVQSSDIQYSGLLTPPSDAPSTSRGADTSYLFTIRWRPSRDLSVYARSASAYRPGGPQYSPSPSVPSSFGPDSTWDYEVGAKGVWASGRISVDADLYYIRWTSIQLDALLGGVTVTGNGGNAHSEGAEVQAQLVPVPRLVIGAGAAYDQTRMDSVNPDNTAGAVVGDPLPYIPKWSGSLTADYAFPLGKCTASVGASYIAQGSRPSSFSDDSLNTDVTIPAYQIGTLRARIDFQQYSVIFRIDNVTNVRALANTQTLRLFPGEAVPANGLPVRPRTFRFSIEARF